MPDEKFLEEEKEKLKFITGMLERRGLYLDKNDEWEVHGPHPGMNYQVFVGTAYEKEKTKCLIESKRVFVKRLIHREFFVSI